MTARLKAALAENQHLIGDRVLYSPTMEQVTAKVIQKLMARAQRRAKLKANGGFHLLRHTFCSHLAMRGAPAIAIQKLAGHKNLQTTLRYMHLAPGETQRAIGLLDAGRAAEAVGVAAKGGNDSSQATEAPPDSSEAGGDIVETEAKVLPFFKNGG